MTMIRIDRDVLDEACFAAVQQVMEEVKGWTTRQRLTVTLNVVNALFATVNTVVKDTTKSESASRAAKKRWAGTKSQRGDPEAATEPKRRRRGVLGAATNDPDAMRTVPLAPEVPLPPADSGMVPAPFGSSERI